MIATLIPLAGLLIGGFMVFMASADGRKAKTSVQWPAVPGVVVFSGMTPDGDDSSPVVAYSYQVNGQMFRSSRVRFNPVKSKKVLTQYPLGSQVRVFFDPVRPATAVLERGGSTAIGFLVGGGVILASLVAGIVLR